MSGPSLAVNGQQEQDRSDTKESHEPGSEYDCCIEKHEREEPLKRARSPPKDRLRDPQNRERVVEVDSAAPSRSEHVRSSQSGRFVSGGVAPMMLELKRGGDVRQVKRAAHDPGDASLAIAPLDRERNAQDIKGGRDADCR